MRYSYYLNASNAAESIVDQTVGRMVEQARISTRRRSCKWELKVHAGQIKIRFLHMADRNDFLEAFHTHNAGSLKQDGYIVVGDQYAHWHDRAEYHLQPARTSLKK